MLIDTPYFHLILFLLPLTHFDSFYTSLLQYFIFLYFLEIKLTFFWCPNYFQSHRLSLIFLSPLDNLSALFDTHWLTFT